MKTPFYLLAVREQGVEWNDYINRLTEDWGRKGERETEREEVTYSVSE
jgi:hypothetical protein